MTLGPRLSLSFGHNFAGFNVYFSFFFPHIILLKKHKVVTCLFDFIVYHLYINDDLLQIQ